MCVSTFQLCLDVT